MQTTTLEDGNIVIHAHLSEDGAALECTWRLNADDWDEAMALLQIRPSPSDPDACTCDLCAPPAAFRHVYEDDMRDAISKGVHATVSLLTSCFQVIETARLPPDMEEMPETILLRDFAETLCSLHGAENREEIWSHFQDRLLGYCRQYPIVALPHSLSSASWLEHYLTDVTGQVVHHLIQTGKPTQKKRELLLWTRKQVQMVQQLLGEVSGDHPMVQAMEDTAGDIYDRHQSGPPHLCRLLHNQVLIERMRVAGLQVRWAPPLRGMTPPYTSY